MAVGKPDSHIQNNDAGPLLSTIDKNELKMEQRPKLNG